MIYPCIHKASVKTLYSLVAAAMLTALIIAPFPLTFTNTNLSMPIAHAQDVTFDDGGNTGGTSIFTSAGSLGDSRNQLKVLQQQLAGETDPTRRAQIQAEIQAQEENVRNLEQNASSIPQWFLSGLTATFDKAWTEIKVWLAWMPIAISGSLLGIVGLAFDFVAEQTITNFSTFYKDSLSTGVDAAWTGFRDIANIVMIAMFVFVSFAVILNSTTYGLKQFGVKILVVALLINFSLFFTKLIIDASNITAIQFRKAIDATTVTTNTTVADNVVTNTLTGGQGIAGIFMQRAGLPNLWDSTETLKEQDKQDTLFVYSVTTSIFFIATMAVLLFGAILLVTRVVVFLLLMITSSLAFAAYMIPKYGQSWWNKWWEALIKNALFAPLFMMLLWAVIRVTGEFGNITANSDGTTRTVQGITSGNITESVFQLAVVLGLLYGATKIANELSMVGAKWAKSVAGKGFGKGLSFAALPFTKPAQLFARQTAGRLAGGARNAAQRVGLGPGVDKALKRIQTSSMHLGDTKISKALEKATGVQLGFKGPTETEKADYELERYKKGFGPVARQESKAIAAAEEEVRGGGAAGKDTAKAIKEGMKEGAKIVGEKREVLSQTPHREAALRGTIHKEVASETKIDTGQDAQNRLTGEATKIQNVAEDIRQQTEQQLRQNKTDALLSDATGVRQSTPAPAQESYGDLKSLTNAIEGFRQQEAAFDERGMKSEASQYRQERKTLERVAKAVPGKQVDFAYGKGRSSPYMKNIGEAMKKRMDPNAKRFADLEARLSKQIKDASSSTQDKIGGINIPSS